MIVKKFWQTKIRWKYNGSVKETKTWRGWFLFGIIPLYIEMIDWKKQ